MDECFSEIKSFVIPLSLKNKPCIILPFKLNILFSENLKISLKVIVGVFLGFILHNPFILINPFEYFSQVKKLFLIHESQNDTVHFVGRQLIILVRLSRSSI